ncbi:hypothetical protein CDAR_401781 [Caerostris darwini]|uniref:Endonuclease/exonuclease/phosphatase domain-containing protein n=1 Tax=Caerostris darwini TaxID=1538125 RepID=A0AAV4V0A7_9ARAC|nr:hypothetical protein CDAR_401781 [Caerostris darwini]
MENPICANCKGPHPAYRGCPKFPKPATTTNQPKSFTSTYSNPNAPYTSLLAPTPFNHKSLLVFADQHSPDVILVQETRVRPGTNSPNLPNNIYRNDFILSDNRRRYSYPGGTGI